MTTPPDDTTEGLREQIARALRTAFDHRIVAEWVCCDPVQPGHDLCVNGQAAREMVASLLADDRTRGGSPSPILDAVVETLARLCDPGDLPARMAEAIAEKFTPQSAVYGEDREYRDATLAERADKGALAVFFTAGDGHRSFRSPTAREVAKVAASVCWEHAASQTAEVERLRTALAATRSDVDAMQREVHRHVLANAEQQGKVERLRAELAEEKVDNKGLRDRLYYANADATRAEAERDALKAAIETGDVARFAADVHRLVADYSNEERGVIALMPFEATLDQLCLEKYGFDLEKVAALDAPETPRDAETEDSDG